MIRLLKIELRKLIPYPTFWILMALHFILAWLVISGLRNFITNIEVNGMEAGGIDFTKIPIFHFPDIWHNITYVAGFFKIILAIMIIISVCNEFSYKTIRQNIIDGLSRMEFLFSKFSFILVLSLVATGFIFCLGIFLGLNHTPESNTISFFYRSEFLLAYFIEVLTYLTFALLIGFLVKRSGLSIGLLLLYTVVIEPIIAYNLPDHIDAYLPLSTLNDLILFPFTKYIGESVHDTIAIAGLGVALLYTLIFFGSTYFLLQKKDL